MWFYDGMLVGGKKGKIFKGAKNDLMESVYEICTHRTEMYRETFSQRFIWGPIGAKGGSVGVVLGD